MSEHVSARTMAKDLYGAAPSAVPKAPPWHHLTGDQQQAWIDALDAALRPLYRAFYFVRKPSPVAEGAGILSTTPLAQSPLDGRPADHQYTLYKGTTPEERIRGAMRRASALTPKPPGVSAPPVLVDEPAAPEGEDPDGSYPRRLLTGARGAWDQAVADGAAPNPDNSPS